VEKLIEKEKEKHHITFEYIETDEFCVTDDDKIMTPEECPGMYKWNTVRLIMHHGFRHKLAEVFQTHKVCVQTVKIDKGLRLCLSWHKKRDIMQVSDLYILELVQKAKALITNANNDDNYKVDLGAICTNDTFICVTDDDKIRTPEECPGMYKWNVAKMIRHPNFRQKLAESLRGIISEVLQTTAENDKINVYTYTIGEYVHLNVEWRSIYTRIKEAAEAAKPKPKPKADWTPQQVKGIKALSSLAAVSRIVLTLDSTDEDIRAAYKKLALKHHPDKGGSDEAMKAINAAYVHICGK
jgi:hypothetical protein